MFDAIQTKSETVQFLPVETITDPLTISFGVSGSSGTGKTYTAFLVAAGIADYLKEKHFGVVDTENRRALHYRDAFPGMVHFGMDCVVDDKMLGYPPERWIEIIDAAERVGLPVLVIDSFSHAWASINGVLELHAREVDRLSGGNDARKSAVSQLAWASIKPRYRQLIERIIRAKLHIIICTRAKPVMKDIKTGLNARTTKIRRNDVPFDIVGDGDLIFEMSCQWMLDPARPGCPVHEIKCMDQLKGLFPRDVPMSIETGRGLAKWATDQKSGEERKHIMDEARAAARQGNAAFMNHWKATPNDQRAILKPIMPELKGLTEEADAAPSEEDPFGAQSAQEAQDASEGSDTPAKDSITDAQRAEAQEAYEQWQAEQERARA